MTGTPPRHDRVLRLCGAGEPDRLDPVVAYHPPAGQLVRLFTRQLFTYPAEADLRQWRAVAPVPDLALAVPSTYNAGVGASHRSYVVHLRADVRWDSTPPRPVTAFDVVRGFKRLANPVVRPPVLGYFTSTIRGMDRYCAQYRAAVPAGERTPEALAAFQRENEIPGVFALDDATVVFELCRPALDFINILALGCASPAPVEYDAYLPDSAELRANLRANGPYRLVEWHPGRLLRFEPNPMWRKDTDPVREQRLTAVEVSLGPADSDRISQRLSAGQADLPWGSAVPRDGDDRADLGWALDPYLVANLRDGALRATGVRRAVDLAVDRPALAALAAHLDPGSIFRAAYRVVPPGNDGWTDPADDPVGVAVDRAADPDRARESLSAAGHPEGVPVVLLHQDDDAGTRIATRCAADLDRAGLRVRLLGASPARYHRLLAAADRDSADAWDLAVASRVPDWHHGNGRVFLQPMFQSGPDGGTANWGGYRDHDVDELIERALDEPVPARAGRLWRAVERQVLADAVVVPLLFRHLGAHRHSARVRDAIALPSLGYTPDLSVVRLAPAR